MVGIINQKRDRPTTSKNMNTTNSNTTRPTPTTSRLLLLLLVLLGLMSDQCTGAPRVFICGCSPRSLGRKVEPTGEAPIGGQSPSEVEAVCRYCLYISTAETINTWNYRTIDPPPRFLTNLFYVGGLNDILRGLAPKPMSANDFETLSLILAMLEVDKTFRYRLRPMTLLLLTGCMISRLWPFDLRDKVVSHFTCHLFNLPSILTVVRLSVTSHEWINLSLTALLLWLAMLHVKWPMSRR